jgi:hypothetical protein
MNKTELLNRLLGEQDEDAFDFNYVEFRPNNGWYLCWSYPRHIGDEGIYLGSNYKESYDYLIFLGYKSDNEKKET